MSLRYFVFTNAVWAINSKRVLFASVNSNKKVAKHDCKKINIPIIIVYESVKSTIHECIIGENHSTINTLIIMIFS